MLFRSHRACGVGAVRVGGNECKDRIALDEALRRLESQRPRVARVVHLRFYAGLSVDETARTLGVSARTVDLDWAFARAWLYKELADAANPPGKTDE